MKLTIFRGLPGSGKTTAARAMPGMRVNRDDIRAMLLPTWPHGARAAEDACTRVQLRAIEALLLAGHDVVSDDTNLDPEWVRELGGMARDAGAEVVIADFTGVPLTVCLERDALRPAPVGADVICGMHDRWLAA